MNAERAWRLFERTGLRGYDPAARTVRPWWWPPARYQVEVREDDGVPHVLGSRMVVSGLKDACPHVVVHGFVHEAGHVQMLMPDLFVLTTGIGFLEGASWWVWVVALLAWQFGWREMTADLYAASNLGVRNAWLGYAHMFGGRGPRPRASASGAGDDRGT